MKRSRVSTNRPDTQLRGETRYRRLRRLCSLCIALLLITTVVRGADLNSEAQALQTRGDWAGLKNLALSWSKSDPGSAAPWLYLGVADDQLGQTTAAIKAYERVLAIDPRLATGAMYLAADYHKTGQHRKLAELITKLQATNPSMAMMMQNQYAADLPREPGGGVPSGFPHKAAALLAHARQWRSDAELMIIDVNDWSNNGHYSIQYDFFSPSNGTGYAVMDGTERPVGAANWGTVPIPSEFLDLPSAIEQARARGMANNTWNHAHLQAGNNGLTWTIGMTHQIATANDPFSRVNAFEIPAGRGSMLGSSSIGNATVNPFGGATGGANTTQQYDTTTGMPCPTGGCVTNGFVGKYAKSGGVGAFAVAPPTHDPMTGALIPGSGGTVPQTGLGGIMNSFGMGGAAAAPQNPSSGSPAQPNVVGGILNSFGIGAGSSAPQNGYNGGNPPAAGYYPSAPSTSPAQSDQSQIERQRRAIQQLQGQE